MLWRETEVQARAGARAVDSVVGLEALLRERVRQQREALRIVVCQRRKKVLCERLKLRHVPRHVFAIETHFESRAAAHPVGSIA